MSGLRFKFRIFDKFYHNYVDDEVCEGISLYDLYEMNEEEFIIEQCTGKKDRNGIPVYENDILRFSRKVSAGALGRTTDEYNFYAVKFRNGAFIIQNMNDENDCAVIWNSENFEVVGNLTERAMEKGELL